MADKEGLLPFKLIEEEFGEALTSYGGLPFVVETCEALGLGRLVKQHVRIKQRHRGYTESKAKGKEGKEKAKGSGRQRGQVFCYLLFYFHRLGLCQQKI